MINKEKFNLSDQEYVSRVDQSRIKEIVEQIKWVSLQGPLNLWTPVLTPYPENQMKIFLEELFNPSLYEPYQRWQFTRRMINPLWTKGSGFEGHFIGLKEEEVLLLLKDFEDMIWRWASQSSYGGNWQTKENLEAFLADPKKEISLEFAQNMRTTFGVLLARARAIRLNLQRNNISENKRFQDRVYSAKDIVYTTFSFQADTGVFTISSENLNHGGSSGGLGDIRTQYPALAEIGRFGYPPLGLILRHFFPQGFK